jgi:hypothetical protein
MARRSAAAKFRALAAIVATVLSAGCTTVSLGGDQLCSEIARFANSSDDSAVHTVELLTDWGGVFSEDKNTVFEKACKHDQYAPAKKLCDYLLENTSTEFATVNFRRALSCLGQAQAYAGPQDARIEYLNGKVTSLSARGVRADVQVSVEFSTGSNERPPSLKIAAARIGS